MTKNRRYEAHYDALNDLRRADSTDRPATLPVQAYGPNPIEWAEQRPTVWAWVHFPDQRPAERRPGYVKGFNDRVAVVWVDGPGGG